MTVLDRLHMLRKSNVMTIVHLGQNNMIIERGSLKYDASIMTIEEGFSFAEEAFADAHNKELEMLRDRVKELEVLVDKLEAREEY